MASSVGGPEWGPELDELRRRVYGPGATDEDRARYRDLVAGSEAVGSAAVEAASEPAAVDARSEPPTPTPAPRRRRRGLLVAAALTVVALAGLGIGLLPRGPAVPPSPSPQALEADGPTRGEFVQDLADGGAAGIAAYLVTHRSPPQLRGASRFFTIERNGTGPGAFSLNDTPPEAETGRATVFLVLEVEGRAAWTAYRLRAQTDDPEPDRLQPVASRSGDQQGGELTAATFAYPSGSRPVRLRIDVPVGVRWGAAVVFSD